MASQGILVVALLLLLPASAFASKFWYLNCGSSTGFIDSSNITWVGDEQFLKSGTGVRTSDGGSTMRVFPKKKKNCYTIPVGEDSKVRVRARFYYGNYDGKNKPPTFELMFDTTDLTIVQLSNENALIADIIYVARRKDTNICLGRLFEDQDPVIYYLILHVLDRDMYSRVNSSYILYRPIRYAFGANESISNPDDDYDRYWYPTDSLIDISANYVNLTSNATTIAVNTSSIVDQPPAKMFRNAIAPAPPANNLSITTTFLFSDPRDIYLNMYFSEISIPQTNSPSTRSFHIYMDDTMISDVSNPIRPLFGEALEFTASFLQATENTTFTLVATADSILPLIISGMEVMRIGSFSMQATDSRDVDGSAILQEKFPALNSWSGDPCLPLDFNWEWVKCNSDDSPRITQLILNGYGLRGTLPDFSILDALVIIDLHNNSLTGSIPEFLATLPNLQVLNLAYNDFSSIPSSIVNNKWIHLNVTGNPQLDNSASPPSPTMNEPSPTANGPPPLPATNGCKVSYGLAFSVHMLMLLIVAIF